MTAFDKVLFEVHARSLEGLTRQQLLHDSAPLGTPWHRRRRDCLTFCHALQFLLATAAAVSCVLLLRLHLQFAGRPGCLPAVARAAICTGGVFVGDASAVGAVAAATMAMEPAVASAASWQNNPPDVADAAAARLRAAGGGGGGGKEVDSPHQRRWLVEPGTPEAFGDDLVMAEANAGADGGADGDGSDTAPAAAAAATAAAQAGNCSGTPGAEDLVYIYFARDLPLGPAAAPADNHSTAGGADQAPAGAAGAAGASPAAPTALAATAAAAAATAVTLPLGANWTMARYEWSQTAAVVALSPDARAAHNFTSWHLILEDAACGVGAWSLPLHTWQDAAVVNMLMASFGSDGLLRRRDSNETWAWSARDAEPPPTTVLDVLGRKVSALAGTLLSFFTMSFVTSLVVRVLIANGTLLLAAVAAVGRAVVPRFQLTTRMVIEPYPWLIERALFLLQGPNAEARLNQFLLAHVGWLFAVYMLYETAQTAWTFWFFPKSFPQALSLWLFLWAFSAEYVALIYLRARLSIRFFPRYYLLFWTAFHLYFYSTAYGFYVLAVCTATLATWAALLHFVLHAELPALASGTVSARRPRHQWVVVEGPGWTSALPPLWSMFHPLNAEAGPSPLDQIPELFGPHNPGADTTPSTSSDDNGDGAAYARQHDDDDESYHDDTTDEDGQ